MQAHKHAHVCVFTEVRGKPKAVFFRVRVAIKKHRVCRKKARAHKAGVEKQWS